jgi:PAS domain S-box-containing protein
MKDELIQARDNLEEVVKKRTVELEEAYKKVAESEQKFREIFYNAYDMITLCGTRENGMPGCYIDVNDVACELLGYSRDELLKMTPMDLMSPENIAKIPETIEIMSKKGFATVEKVYIVKDGSEIPVEVNTHVFDLNGKKVGLAVSRDITKRKKREKQLEEILNELKRSNEELQQFAYVSSHDLQEPLRTIASFTQLLQKRYKGQLDEDADEFMEYIVEAAVRMKQQIQDLLEYSRVATKENEFKSVNLNEILDTTLTYLDTLIKESNAEINVEKLPVVMGDSGQLQSVFQNLISNAIKFKKHEEPLKIHISSYKDEENKEYVFSIKDNGIGIEEQYSERIFTIFQRLHARDEYKGTGIGLSIVKRIIERHGGRIWVESEFGGGSTFYFTIPIKNKIK